MNESLYGAPDARETDPLRETADTFPLETIAAGNKSAGGGRDGDWRRDVVCLVVAPTGSLRLRGAGSGVF